MQSSKQSSKYICGKASPTTNGYSAKNNKNSIKYANISKINNINQQNLLKILGLSARN